MQHVYIDESGEPGTSSRYIVVAALAVAQDRKLKKAITLIWKAKPQFHLHGELHAHAVDDATRRRVLKTIGASGSTITYVVIDKRKHRTDMDAAYYGAICALVDAHAEALSIVVDRRDTDKKRSKILQRLGLEEFLRRVEFRTSHSMNQLQAVDFVAWAIGRYYEHGSSEFMELLPNVRKL